MKIILSRTDSIGDVVLSLPLAGYLKKNYNYEIIFLGREYTRPLLELCQNIDKVITKEQVLKNPLILKELRADAILFLFPDKELAKISQKIKIPLRIGTAHRYFHWLYLNKKIFFSRKRSSLHESQLNFFLVQGLGIFYIPPLSQIPSWYGLQINPSIPQKKKGITIILHPKSKGHGREWPLKNYAKLVELLPQINFYITGVAEEGEFIRKNCLEIFNKPNVHDLTGKLSLKEFISLISSSDGLVAASTGPLHIAAALGKLALGLFPPIRPIDPQRWAPLGVHAHYLLGKEVCFSCPFPKNCPCMDAIEPMYVKERLLDLIRHIKV